MKLLKAIGKKLKKDYIEFVHFADKYEIQFYIFFALLFTFFTVMHIRDGEIGMAIFTGLVAITDYCTFVYALVKKLKKKDKKNRN